MIGKVISNFLSWLSSASLSASDKAEDKYPDRRAYMHLKIVSFPTSTKSASDTFTHCDENRSSSYGAWSSAPIGCRSDPFQPL